MDLTTRDEVQALLQRLELVIKNIADASASKSSDTSFQTRVDGLLKGLKEDVERLSGLIKGLDSLLQSHDKTNPGILSRLQDIERTIGEIREHLTSMEEDNEIFGTNQTRLVNLEGACATCRQAVEAKMNKVEALATRFEKFCEEYAKDKALREQADAIAARDLLERKESSKNLKAIVYGQAATIIGGIVTWLGTWLWNALHATNKVAQ